LPSPASFVESLDEAAHPHRPAAYFFMACPSAVAVAARRGFTQARGSVETYENPFA